MNTFYSFTVSPPMIAAALNIPLKKVRRLFKDGRVVAGFCELWAETICGVRKHKRGNGVFSDCYALMPDEEPIEVAVRTLTPQGIKFQDSRYIGTGRTCDVPRLKASIRRFDSWIVFDICNFPRIAVYKLKGRTLEEWIDSGDLRPTGLKPQRFIDLLRSEDGPKWRPLDLAL